jgi:DNA-binding transcriptional ArsR family regulator
MPLVQDVRLDRTFAALADPTRRAILRRLSRGEALAGELAAPFAMSLPAVSKHLKVLEAAGLLVREKRGREHRCRLEPAPIRAGEAWMDELRRFWEARLDVLAELLERDSATKPTRPKTRRT